VNTAETRGRQEEEVEIIVLVVVVVVKGGCSYYGTKS
jgi:hypothetical protein